MSNILDEYVRPCSDVKDLKCRIEYGKENSIMDSNGIVNHRCVPNESGVSNKAYNGTNSHIVNLVPYIL